MKIYQMPAKKSVSASPSTAPVTTPTPVPVPVPVPEPTPVPLTTAAEPVTTVVEEVSSSAKFTSLLEKLQSFSTDLKELIATVKTLQKEHVKLQKLTTKKSKKQSSGNGGTRTLSGFAKPSLLSDELCEFMGVTKGTLMARTEVTRSINEYIKKNSLQDVNDKRHIVADDKLKKILNLGADDKLTYFNLQKYMKHHFTKQA